MGRIKHAMTKPQKKYYSYLYYERLRQEGSCEEWSSYPEFMLTCCGCTVELKTSDCQTARNFVEDHAGHKTVLEINHFPNAIKYDSREDVLERLADLGKYLVQEGVDPGVVKNARLTYKFIRNEGDIQGSLQRLMEVFLGTKDGQCLTTDFQRLWLRSIFRNDHKFISRVTERVVSRMGEN